MSETHIDRDSPFIFRRCRVCLKAEDIRLMSHNEIIWYQNILQQTTSEQDSKMCVCDVCGHLLRKHTIFSAQCRRAQHLFYQNLKRDFRTQRTIHNFIITHPTTNYVGPETNSNITISSLNTEQYLFDNIKSGNDDCETYSDEGPGHQEINFDDDDDVPLMMLGKSNKQNGKTKKKRKTSSYCKTKLNDTEVKQEVLEEYSDGKEEKRKRSEKQLREGFSSRMVQETPEYVVIKLTKEEVLAELDERRAAAAFLRAPYSCRPCALAFNFRDVLARHMRRHRPAAGWLQCGMCAQYCRTAVALRGHVKSHSTRYRCKVCGETRRSRQHALEHHARAHQAAPPAYCCRTCAFRTDKRTVMQRHVRGHRAAAGAGFPCAHCPRRCKTRESLRVHTARHDASRWLQCGQCSRRFLYPALLERHVEAAHCSRDLYCVECDLRFKSHDNLRLHFKKAKRHRDPTTAPGPQSPRAQQYSCQHCQQTFTRKSMLTAHMRAHRDVTPPTTSPDTLTVTTTGQQTSKYTSV